LKRFSRSSERFSLRLPGALGYFADVDKARMPEMLSKTTWEKVKTDLEKLVVRGVDV
jgi:hypothetical protein